MNVISILNAFMVLFMHSINIYLHGYHSIFRQCLMNNTYGGTIFKADLDSPRLSEMNRTILVDLNYKKRLVKSLGL